MRKQTSKKHGGSGKYGRNKAKCERYRAAGTRERNKRAHIERAHRNDALEDL